jgi:large subunit ribosomal protein L18
MTKETTEARLKRHRRVRQRVSGTSERPRLCVYRSNKHIFAQLIDDTTGITISGVSDLNIKKKSGLDKTGVAGEVGKLIAEKAKAKKIDTVVFDRGGRLYHGRVKALAEGAREGGLKF